MSLTRERTAARPILNRQRIAELRIQCQQDPNDLDLHREIIAEFLANGLPVEALPLLQRLAARCPEDAALATQLATVLAESGRDRDAFEQWKHVAELRPDSADAQHNLGIAACRLADHAMAIKAFERKLEIDSNCFETYNDLAVLYAMTGRDDDAATTYARGLRLNPRYGLARKNAFQFFSERGRNAEGLQLVQELIAIVGNDGDLRAWQRRLAEPEPQTLKTPIRDVTHSAMGAATRVQNKKIAFVGSSDTFLKTIISHFQPQNEVRMFSGQSVRELAELMRWADLTWLDRCDRFATDSSKFPRTGKVVCRVHASDALTEMPNQMNWRNIDRLILVNEAVGEILDQFWKIPTPRTVIHNGVDSGRFPFVKRTRRGKKIASVGYINHLKNPSLLLQTIKAIHTYDPEFELHIAGDHQDPRIKVYMDHLLPRLDIPVTFHGWVKDMPAFYADMDYVISTSLIESLHYSIAEGMLSGCLPLIHSWKGSDGLYPDHCIFDTPEEAIALIDYYNSDDPEQFAADHRDFIIGRYEWRDRLDEIDRTLNEVLGGTTDRETTPRPSVTLAESPKSENDYGKVSIVIAAQDDAACLTNAVTTALNQTYANTEVIVCIDGATDDSEKALAAFGDRITVVRQVRHGLPAAFNTAIQQSHGEYVALLRACDAMSPERVEKQVRRLAGSPDIGFVACRATNLDGGCIANLEFDEHQAPAPSTMMFRRDLLDHIGWFDEAIPTEDSLDAAMHSLWRRMQECTAGKLTTDTLVCLHANKIQNPSPGVISVIDDAHNRWARHVRCHVNHEFASKPAATPLVRKHGSTKIVFVGATDPHGQMAMWADAINRHTDHHARVLTHSETTGCPSDLVLNGNGHAGLSGKERGENAVVEEAAQVAADADIVVFAAGLASGCLRSESRLEDTDEQPFGRIHWPDVVGRKQCVALVFSTPSVRGNLAWYRDRFAQKGWPVLTCDPDIHRWLPESRYFPRVLSRTGKRFVPHTCQSSGVAVVHSGAKVSAPAGIDFHAVVTEIKRRFPTTTFGRYADLPYHEALAMKASAHVAIDQIAVGTGSFGIDSLENSALGLANIVYCSPYARALLAETIGTDDLPWDSPATTEELIGVLSAYMDDTRYLTERMHDTKQWFETYWNESRIVNRVIGALLDDTGMRPGS